MSSDKPFENAFEVLQQDDGLYRGSVAFFEQGLSFPLRKVTGLLVPVQHLAADHFTRALGERTAAAYFIGLVSDEAFDHAPNVELSDEELDEVMEAVRLEAQREDYEGLVILGLDLRPRESGRLPTRTELAAFTRIFNRAFHGRPVAVVFRYPDRDGNCMLSLAACERTAYKQAWREGDKPGRVSLLRDIDLRNPHAGHLRILNDLRIERTGRNAVRTFRALHEHWQSVFNTSILSKEFYRELADWFFWACRTVTFPGAPAREKFDSDRDHARAVHTHTATQTIRLITRLLFTWFLKEKGLVARELFDEREVQRLLKPNVDESCYYKAILQNLFFATLCKEMDDRRFRVESGSDFGVTTRYRYESYFQDSERFLGLQGGTPFLNCGLFECQDKPDPKELNRWGKPVMQRLDGFSDHPSNPLAVPDELFWGGETEADLREEYGRTAATMRKVRGLIRILHSYKFTITENTPLEQDIALDPELLGKVFENLLAAYNPETETTARKQTGSFYTPREIVDYMVTESLVAYLETQLSAESGGPHERTAELEPESFTDRLRVLLGDGDEQPFADSVMRETIVDALARVKVLDPACGSGAFPMGCLHRIVHALKKLDPGNTVWKQRQLDAAEGIDDPFIRDHVIKEIEAVFSREHGPDYGRKLYLIENCIFGIDIQPIAVQISRLRFFISLMVDQDTDPAKPNVGVKPLPNLETKFVAGNTLIKLDRPEQLLLRNLETDRLERELANVRHRHFNAKTWDTKLKYREEDRDIREQLGKLLETDGWEPSSADQVAAWDPYDQNASAPFFDPEWMFNITTGFDIVIGNPPFLGGRNWGKEHKALQEYFRQTYKTADYQFDLYVLFWERGVELCCRNGVAGYITPNTWLNNQSNRLLRRHLLAVSRLREISDYSDVTVFESGVVLPIVTLAQLCPSKGQATTIKCYASDGTFTEHLFPQDAWRDDELSVINLRLTTRDLALRGKMEAASGPLCGHAVVKFGIKLYETGKGMPPQTPSDARDKVFESTYRVDMNYRPYLEGKDVERYRCNWQGRWLKYGRNLAAPREPALFEGTRLVFRRIVGDTLVGTLLDGDFVTSQLLQIVKPTVPAIALPLLGVLNSRAVVYYFRKKFGREDKTFPEIRVYELEQLPIPKQLGPEAERLGGRVQALLGATQAGDPTQLNLDAEIDARVARLYGLTREEYDLVLSETNAPGHFRVAARNFFEDLERGDLT